MKWQIDFYSGVEDQILEMPPNIQARMIKLLELMAKRRPHLGAPHAEAIGDGLL